MIGLALLAAATAVTPPSPCRDLLASSTTTPAAVAKRSVGVRDLVRLRDFGPFGEGLGSEAFLAISPDRRRVAFQLRQADPTTNSYCLGLIVLDLASGGARLVDEGGDVVRLTYTHNGLVRFKTGVPQAIMPSWSPDGRALVMLKRDAGSTQVWSIRSDGSGAEQLTHEAQDVTAATWSSDGRRVIYRTDRSVPDAERAIDTEGLHGWHYDARFLPMATARPFAATSDPKVYSLDVAIRTTVASSSGDRMRLEANETTSDGEQRRRDGHRVELASAPDDPAVYQSPRTLRWRDGGTERVCRDDPCARARAFWLGPDGTSVLILARSGWGGGDLRFYRWAVRSGRITPLSTTSDLLLGCRPLRHLLLCARETATQPRRVVLLDPVSGRSRALFNPNADYDQLTTGSVERLRLKGDNGSKTFADVMLPPGFVVGRRYPMVVVQYESRGFLRGGTGNEYPIPVLAAAGMIVLSFQRTIDVAVTAMPPPTSDTDFNRIDFTGWADRRRVNAALMDGVEQMIARGSIDAARVGITGLSDGVATAAFALLGTRRFLVAALSGCCEEPVSDMVLQGPAFAEMLRAAGYPPYSRPDPGFWSPYSVEQNAGRIKTPMLVQAPDREFLFSLPTIQALRERNVPVDLYVYPGEFHVKWQPAHRAAVFERVVRWFQFWFDLPPMPGQMTAPADELARWRAFRAARQTQLPDRVGASP